MCDMTDLYVWHDSFIYVTRLIHVCDMNWFSCGTSFHPSPSYMWHDSFIYVIWLLHICDRTNSLVWHDAFIHPVAMEIEHDNNAVPFLQHEEVHFTKKTRCFVGDPRISTESLTKQRVFFVKWTSSCWIKGTALLSCSISIATGCSFKVHRNTETVISRKFGCPRGLLETP